LDRRTLPFITIGEKTVSVKATVSFPNLASRAQIQLTKFSVNHSLLTLLPSSFLARIARDYSPEIGELSIGILLEKA